MARTRKTPDAAAAKPAARRRKRNVLVRATIHMPGIGVGQRVYVDPESPHIAELLAGGLLVPVADGPGRG
jgi:hypothetical protein